MQEVVNIAAAMAEYNATRFGFLAEGDNAMLSTEPPAPARRKIPWITPFISCGAFVYASCVPVEIQRISARAWMTCMGN